MTHSQPVVDVALCLVLAWVAVEDARRFRIRNGLVVLLAATFVALCLAQGTLSALASHGLFALAGLLLLFGAFAYGLLGGGDAKLLAVALLWIGPGGAFVFSVGLLACSVAYILGARAGWLPVRRIGSRTKIPFGPSIAGAWIMVIIFTALVRDG